MVAMLALGCSESASAVELDREELTDQLAWEQAAWEVLDGLDLAGCEGGFGVEIGASERGAPALTLWAGPETPSDGGAAVGCVQERIAGLTLPAGRPGAATFAWVEELFDGMTLVPAWTLDDLDIRVFADSDGIDPITLALAQGPLAWQVSNLLSETRDGIEPKKRRQRLVYYGLLSRALRAVAVDVERCTAEHPRDAPHAYGNWQTRIRVAPSGHIELLEQTLMDVGWSDGRAAPVGLEASQGPTSAAARCLAFLFEGVRLPKPPGALHAAIDWVRLPRTGSWTRAGEPSQGRLVPGSMPKGTLDVDHALRVIERRVDQLGDCYGAEGGPPAELEEPLQVTLLVAPSGRVQRARTAESSPGDPSEEVRSCVAETLQKLRFRPPGGFVTFLYAYGQLPK